jgi:hypothetical protein
MAVLVMDWDELAGRPFRLFTEVAFFILVISAPSTLLGI